MIPSHTRTDFDVVIAGGGMVGPCLAALLAGESRLAGLRIALLDPAQPRRPVEGSVDLRVSALSRASQRILAAAAAWSAVEPHAAAYDQMRVWDAAGTVNGRDSMCFTAAELGEPNLGHIVENLRVQWALHESPLLRDVTHIRTGLAAVATDEDGSRVTLDDGRSVTCQLLAGADGPHSPTRERAGIRRTGWSYGQTAVVAHLRSELPHQETAWQRFLPSGPLALLPLRDGRVSLVWTTTPEHAQRLQDCDPDEFARAVTDGSDRALGDLMLDSGRAGFELGFWHAREYVRPALALVGDAAHTLHPLAGQGVNLGYLDCAALVQVLAEGVARDGEFAGPRALRRYERWRRSENALVMGLCDGINRVFTQPGMAAAGLRRAGMAAVAQQPLLRRALVQRALGVTGDVPQLVRRSA